MHLTADPVNWYATRASGLVAYVALTAVAVAGILLAARPGGTRWPRFAIEDVHRFLGTLVWLFLGLHVLTVAISSYVPFSLANLVVPFTSDYRPLWTGLGVTAFDLLLALAVTNRLRARTSYAFWRRAHYLNFGVWACASLHALYGGIDADQGWLVATILVSASAVAGALAYRFQRTGAQAPPSKDGASYTSLGSGPAGS
jgi:predicted ferric reductase